MSYDTILDDVIQPPGTVDAQAARRAGWSRFAIVATLMLAMLGIIGAGFIKLRRSGKAKLPDNAQRVQLFAQPSAVTSPEPAERP